MAGAPRQCGAAILSAHQYRIAQLVADGLKNRQIAAALGRSEIAVKDDLRLIYDRLGLWNRLELALWYEARRREQSLNL